MGERPYTDIVPLVSDLAQALKPELNSPFALFGYSLGALIGFELARELRWRYNLVPSKVFAASFPAPHFRARDPGIQRLSNAEFISWLRRLGATPAHVFENQDVLEVFLPILRADFSIYDRYEYIEEEPLNCPISVFAGLQDKNINQESLEDWKLHTSGDFRLHMFTGMHFFIHRNLSAVLSRIDQEIELVLGNFGK